MIRRMNAISGFSCGDFNLNRRKFAPSFPPKEIISEVIVVILSQCIPSQFRANMRKNRDMGIYFCLKYLFDKIFKPRFHFTSRSLTPKSAFEFSTK